MTHFIPFLVSLRHAATVLLIGITCCHHAIAQESQAIFICTNGVGFDRESFKTRLDQWAMLNELLLDSGIAITDRFYDGRNRSIESKIARLSKKSNQQPFVILFSGPAEVDDHDIQFGDPSLSFSLLDLLETFRTLKSKTNQSPSELIIIADCHSKQTRPQFSATLQSLLAKQSLPVHVAMAIHNDQQTLDGDSLVSCATDALEFDHSCDQNADNQISTGELFQYFQASIGKDRSVFGSSAMKHALRPILSYPDSNLQSTLSQVAGQVAQLCEQQHVKEIAVLPFCSTSAGRPRAPRSGSLTRYMADRIQRELIHRRHLSIPVDLDEIQSHLNACQLSPIELCNQRTLVAETLAEKCFRGGGFLFASFQFERDSKGSAIIRQLTPELLILRNGKQISSTTMDPVETTLSDRQLNTVSPREQIAMMRAGGFNKEFRNRPPMQDANFYPRLYMMVDDQRIEPVYENNEMIVPVNAGERYKIVVDNSNGEDCFIQLLVDGKNTLPERPIPTAEKREPAVRVDLQDARTWFCQKGSVTVYEGFYSEIQAQQGLAAAFAFEVSQDLPTDAIENGDVGQITMAIYAPVEKKRVSMGAVANYCTVLGQRNLAKIRSYTGTRMPDQFPEQIIYLHYGY